MKKILVSFLLLTSFGCATAPQYHAAPNLTPENAATVFLYRKATSYQSANPEKPFFYVDGMLVAKLGTGQATQFLVAPGSHKITSKESLMFNPAAQSGEINGEFKAGKTYYLRYAKDFLGFQSGYHKLTMNESSSLQEATKENFEKRE